MHCYRWRVCGWNTWRVSDRYEWTVSSEYAGIQVLPQVLLEFERNNPAVRINLSEGFLTSLIPVDRWPPRFCGGPGRPGEPAFRD